MYDQFKLLVGAYYGVCEMDEYDLKVYILKDIENEIVSFIRENKIDGFNYVEEARKLEDTLSLKTKLQDSLLVLHRIHAPLELILLVKSRISGLKDMKKVLE